MTRRSTKPLHERIAVVFDFDLTLAPGTLDALLERCGLEPKRWKQDRVSPLIDQGWEEILAKTFALAHAAEEEPGRPITRDLLRDVGRTLEPYDGVPEMFGRLRDVAAETSPEIEVEYYLVSSGLKDIMEATRIAHEFRAMWGTELHFDGGGAIVFPKLVVTHPEKARYILALSKGLDPRGPNAPAHVYQDVPEHDLHVPLDQMIYVGDGHSDMSAFRLLGGGGGLAIGLRKPRREEWNAADRSDPERRVQNLAPPDFRQDSELMISLSLAVGSIARRIALRQLGRDE